MPTLNDGVMKRLAAYSGSSIDRQRQWLADAISPEQVLVGQPVEDLWNMYLTAFGLGPSSGLGSLQERMKSYMNTTLVGAGNTSAPFATYNDTQSAYWNT